MGYKIDEDIKVRKGELLLGELFEVEREHIGEAAGKTERVGKWFEVVVGIGKDHCAYVTLHSDAYAVLYERLLKKEQE